MRTANSRRLLLAADAVFGVLLIVAAFAGAAPRLLAPTASSAPATVVAPELVQRFGGLAPPGQTTGLAVAADSTLGVVDRGRNVVLHLDAGGRPLAEWGPRFGAGLDAQDLLGMAADRDGWYVLDRGAQRVVHLSGAGSVEPERTIDLSALETYGPTGLAVDGSGNLYLADTGRDRILVFDARGQVLRTIGTSGSDLGKLKQPMGIAFRGDGSMFVADWENGRVERFAADGSGVKAWPLPVHAWGLAVDGSGRVYVPDGDRKVVRAFGADGALAFQLGGDSPGGPIPVEFPSQVAVSPDGSTLWVLGQDALARVDLRPFAALQPVPQSEPIRWPLAIAGLLLLALPLAATAAPRLIPRLAPGRPPSPAAPLAASPKTGSPTRAARAASAFPTRASHAATPFVGPNPLAPPEAAAASSASGTLVSGAHPAAPPDPSSASGAAGTIVSGAHPAAPPDAASASGAAGTTAGGAHPAAPPDPSSASGAAGTTAGGAHPAAPPDAAGERGASNPSGAAKPDAFRSSSAAGTPAGAANPLAPPDAASASSAAGTPAGAANTSAGAAGERTAAGSAANSLAPPGAAGARSATGTRASEPNPAAPLGAAGARSAAGTLTPPPPNGGTPPGMFGVEGAQRPMTSVAGRVALIAGAGAAVLAAFRLQDPLIVADPWPSMLLLSVASLVWATGVSLTTQTTPPRWLPDWPTRQPPPGATPRTALAALAAVLPAAVAAVIWWQQHFQTPEATRAAILWLLAIGIAATSVAWHTTWRLPKPGLMAAIPWILFALALAPRIWNNGELPYGVWYDEAQAGLEARRFLAEGRYTPITDTYGRDASLFYYLISAASLLIKDPVAAGRATAAIVGALNAPLLYLLGRELFGWRVGLAAGVLLAASRWHLDVSRLGWDPISLPVCATLAFWLLARAIRTQRWTDLVWAGMALGLGMHGYIGFRAMPGVALVLLFYAAWRRRWSPPRALGSLALVLGAGILVALPVLIFAIQAPAAFNGRLDQTLILAQPGTQDQKLADIWSNIQKHALMFHVQGDMNGRHNLPGWPMLDPISGLLAMLGFAWLLVRLLDWRAWLVFGWGIVAMSGGILTLPFEAPQAMRTLAMTPLLALLCGLAVVLFADRVVRVPRLARLATALAALVVAWIAVLNVTAFFTRQMLDPTVWESFSTRETIPARDALAGRGRFEAILGSPTIAPSLESQLLVPNQTDRIRAFDAISDLPYRGAGPALIILETEHDAALVDEVARYYPNAVHQQIVAPNAVRPLAEQFVLEPDILAARRGIDATYRAADGTTVQRREPSAAMDPATLGFPLPLRLHWRVGLALDVPGHYLFNPPEGLALTIDGAQATPRGLTLPRGNHLLELDGTLLTAQPISVTWQPPTATAPQSLDPRVLYLPPDGGTGLSATFFPSLTWQGTPRDDAIDPMVSHYFHTNPFARLNFDPAGNWSAEWRGQLQAPTSGTYRFETDRLSRAGVWIDERPVFDDTATDAPPQTSGVVELSAGAHQIRVRYQDRAEGGPHIYLFWSPPGGARQVIPGSALYPLPPTDQ